MREQHCFSMQRIALWMEIVNIWLIWGGGVVRVTNNLHRLRQ